VSLVVNIAAHSIKSSINIVFISIIFLSPQPSTIHPLQFPVAYSNNIRMAESYRPKGEILCCWPELGIYIADTPFGIYLHHKGEHVAEFMDRMDAVRYVNDEFLDIKPKDTA